MRDLLQEGRKIQETFKKKIVKEQTLNEGKLSDMIQKLKQMVEKEVDTRYDELTQFFDMEKIERDNPQVSFSEIESDAISALKSINRGQTSEGFVNEDFSSFFASVKNNIKSIFTNVSTFIKALSTIPSVLKLMKYVKDPKGLMKYYSDNMTTDGIRYKGLSKTQLSLEITEGPFFSPTAPLWFNVSVVCWGIIVLALWIHAFITHGKCEEWEKDALGRCPRYGGDQF